MSPAFSSRRRADQFDALLSGALTPAPTPELASLASLADELRELPEVAPRAEFAVSLRERLMAEAAAALAAPPAPDELTRKLTVGSGETRTRSRRERRIGIAIAAFSILAAATGTAAASQGSLPGDTLYPVKRLIESAHTSLSFGDAAKGSTLLGQAADRLSELERLRDRAEAADPAVIEQALNDYSEQATKASDLLLADYAQRGDPATITRLHEFAQQGITTLAGLAGVLPASVDDALAAATQTLIDIDQAASQACPGCGLGSIVELPSSLLMLVGDTVEEVASPIAPPQQVIKAPQVIRAPQPIKSADPTSLPTGEQGGTGSKGSSGTTMTRGEPGSTTSDGGSPVKLPTSSPTSLGDGVGGVVSGVGDTLGQVGDGLGGTLGDTVGGLGDTVDDLGTGLGETVNGLGDTLGGLLGGATP